MSIIAINNFSSRAGTIKNELCWVWTGKKTVGPNHFGKSFRLDLPYDCQKNPKSMRIKRMKTRYFLYKTFVTLNPAIKLNKNQDSYRLKVAI